MSIFDGIPNEIIREMALSLRLRDIRNFGSTNSRFNRVVCRNDEFWHQKFIRDYGNTIKLGECIKYRESWKEMYQRHGMVWICPLIDPVLLHIKNIKIFNNIRVPKGISDFKAKYVSTKKDHAVFIDFENNVWSYGNNQGGQLGIGSRDNYVAIPQQIPNFKAKKVSVGYWHTLFIDMKNNLRACGCNDRGQLGLGDETWYLHPGRIRNINLLGRVREISAGVNYSVIIDMDNNVWSCGYNNFGQLGLGDDRSIDRLTQIPNFKAKQVSAGFNHTAFIDMENNVWTCGENRRDCLGRNKWEYFGQLGLGDNKNRYIPTQIPHFKAKQVSAGDSHTLFIDLNDNVWSCGNNQYGQLGLGDNNPKNVSTPQMIPNINLLGKARQVCAGAGSTLIIDFDNNVWVCGYNQYNQFCLGHTKAIKSLTQIPGIKARQVSADHKYTVIIE